MRLETVLVVILTWISEIVTGENKFTQNEVIRRRKNEEIFRRNKWWRRRLLLF